MNPKTHAGDTERGYLFSCVVWGEYVRTRTLRALLLPLKEISELLRGRYEVSDAQSQTMPLFALLDQALLEAHVHPDFSVTWVLLFTVKIVCTNNRQAGPLRGHAGAMEQSSVWLREHQEAEDMRHGNT